MNYNFSKRYQMRKPVFQLQKAFQEATPTNNTKKILLISHNLTLKSISPFTERGWWVSKLRGSKCTMSCICGKHQSHQTNMSSLTSLRYQPPTLCIVNFKPIKLRRSWSWFKTKIVTKLAPCNSVLISMHKIKFGLRRIITLRGVGVWVLQNGLGS